MDNTLIRLEFDDEGKTILWIRQGLFDLIRSLEDPKVTKITGAGDYYGIQFNVGGAFRFPPTDDPCYPKKKTTELHWPMNLSRSGGKQEED